MDSFQPSIIGHSKQVEMLRALHAHDKLPQAVIFSGEKGLGKGILAREFAAFLIAGQNHPYHQTLHQITHNAHPQVFTLQKEQGEGQIGVEVVREGRKFFHRTADKNQWRILIVDALDDLNRFGSNALLKIVEEPPQRSLVILLNHNRSKLLPTLRSRSYVLPFHELSRSEADLLAQSHPDFDWNITGGNPSLIQGYKDPEVKSFMVELFQCLHDLMQRHADYKIIPFVNKWFSGNEKDSKNEKLEILQQVLLRFTTTITDKSLMSRLWQVNDSLTQNVGRHNIYHLDLTALLCQTLGHLAYR